MKKSISILSLLTVLFFGCSTSNDSNNSITNVLPVAPTNLTGTIVLDSQVNLTWNDNSTNETGFKIERMSGTGIYSVIGTVNANVSTFSDIGLTKSTVYFYRVNSFNAEGNSINYTNIVNFEIKNSSPIIPQIIPQSWLLVAVGGGNAQLNGGKFTIGIKKDGTLWAWGNNFDGQLGDGTTTNKLTPTQIGTANNWQSISVGNSHTIALKTDGTLWGWGSNISNQIGDGTTTNKLIPTQIGTGTNWKSISSASFHTIAIKKDGTLWGWGFTNISDLTTPFNFVIPTQIGTATNWQSISAGAVHNIAVKTDGTLWSWGINENGELGNGNLIPKLTPTQIGTANNWQSISAGYSHNLAIKADGTLWGWGLNSSRQLGDGTTTNKLIPTQIGTGTNWQTISTGLFSTMGIKRDGSLWAWGNNGFGQKGNWAITGNDSQNQIGIDSNWQSLCIVKNFDYINAYTIGVKTDGTLWGWGMEGGIQQLGI